jgi:hypothetical protein
MYTKTGNRTAAPPLLQIAGRATLAAAILRGADIQIDAMMQPEANNLTISKED